MSGTLAASREARRRKLTLVHVRKNNPAAQELGRLANQRLFDQAFINAMIPHHESAIEMAQVALAESTNPTIQDLAGRIVDDQTREISR